MKNGICYIVAAGDFSEKILPEIERGDLLIAADAGYRVLKKAGLEPDLFIGDGDSLGFIPDIKEKTVLPCEKNDTDTHAAIKAGFEKGYRKFCLYGALGGARFSHSLANIQCLSYIADNGGEGCIIDKSCSIRLLCAGDRYRFLQSSGYFSLFAVSGPAEVGIKGAKYSADKISISPSRTLGVSNEPLGECEVAVLSGTVLLVCEE